MSGSVFNISGQVKQGAILVTSGYIRAQNLNRQNVVAIAPIGIFEDGSLEAGRYDAWFRSQEGGIDVVAQGDVFELKVFNTLSDATNNTNALHSAQRTAAVTAEAFNISYMSYELQLVQNLLPAVTVIPSESNLRYTNSRVVYWTWNVPVDPDGDSIHFQVEWGQDHAFAAGTTRTYSTLNTVDRSLFSYENSPDSWLSFPATGITSTNYGKKCRIRITMSGDATYYWRVRATDAIDR